MSYSAQSKLSSDPMFASRVAACAAVEAPKTQHPMQWANNHIWWIAAAPGFADAYEYALDTGVENPGDDPSVITDADILAAVQALVNAAQAQ